jgi:glycosyltransferase involved in cell wall biosynthesis
MLGPNAGAQDDDRGKTKRAAVSAERTRVLRIITRMNMGGPAYHVSLLSGFLDPRRYETVLVTGRVGPGEESLADLAAEYGADLRVLPTLQPELRPREDARALAQLSSVARSFRPHIVHTHTAKAGFLGRVAAVLSGQPRPVIVHTYHGHVLEGYFGTGQSFVFRSLERAGALMSDCLIAVSQATANDLIRLKVAPANKFRVIPLGLQLEPFVNLPQLTRRGSGNGGCGAVTATYVGRLVDIKRIDVMLRAVAHARELGADLRLQVVGHGPLRDSLERLARELGIADHVDFLGYRRDLAAVAAQTDIALLTSDNEGTPVSLIEMAAAGRPLVATAVGGVSEVVREGTGLLAPAGDPSAIGRCLARLAASAELRAEYGSRARGHVLSAYNVDRLLADMDRLYMQLLATRISS